jgi:hypothetical protein
MTMSGMAFSITGCGGGRPEGDLPVTEKTLTKEEADEKAKAVNAGPGGNYKGAPR